MTIEIGDRFRYRVDGQTYEAVITGSVIDFRGVPVYYCTVEDDYGTQFVADAEWFTTESEFLGWVSKKCHCGAASVGSNRHSPYCDLYISSMP